MFIIFDLASVSKIIICVLYVNIHIVEHMNVEIWHQLILLHSSEKEKI